MVFAQLFLGSEVIGIAAGVRTGCGLSLSPRHVYLPTTPALTLHMNREPAMATLREGLRDAGCAELDLDAYDARWEPDADEDAEIVAVRMEYLVELERNTTGCASGSRRITCAPSARRCRRLAAHDRWRREYVGRRAPDLGRRRHRLLLLGGRLVRRRAARANQVGVAGRRAYCRHSQATEAGRDIGALTWLQWTVMCQLARRDVSVYNLARASRQASDKLSHDPLRDRLGFAPVMVRSRRVRWTLSPGHLRHTGCWGGSAAKPRGGPP